MPTPYGSYSIKAQSGNVVVQAPTPGDSVNFNVLGQANITKQLNVGDDPLADGLITTPGNTNLLISPGGTGSLALQPNGPLQLKNTTWPDGTITPNVGYFLGSNGVNSLQFLQFVIAFNGSDTLTQTTLNSLYPTATAGQMVAGPTVIYTCVSANTWRTSGSGGSVPSIPDTQIAFGDPSNLLTSDPNLTFDSGTDTLTVGSGSAGSIEAGPGQSLLLQGDLGVTLKSTGANTFELDPTGTIIISGSAGVAGQVLTTAGPSGAASWTSLLANAGTAPVAAIGSPGDKAGDLRRDSGFIYVCQANYDGSTPIWTKSALVPF